MPVAAGRRPAKWCSRSAFAASQVAAGSRPTPRAGAARAALTGSRSGVELRPGRPITGHPDRRGSDGYTTRRDATRRPPPPANQKDTRGFVSPRHHRVVGHRLPLGEAGFIA